MGLSNATIVYHLSFIVYLFVICFVTLVQGLAGKGSAVKN